ncbi:Epsin-3, clathrin recruitment and traffic between the Golgi and endosome [Kalmusia sp. IMI 367209]|nr:Epsin-3, clathrin recruitment and traffic between the Golgi and endosome [Kalmusia sp. IMI 367209]
MDFASLKDQVSNLTLYDLKAGVRKVQNAVMNYTEMEAKVREATNNEPWGASSTLMQEIANSTFNYQLLNEIMPMIYKRFTEKAAEEWRQIYKALQLLEFLIKNGSERVIDDARSHVSLLKMLRQFHFIDQNGKDQGINVRNRAKELAELLGDVDRIRAERKKARANRNKFGGVEGGMGMGGFSSSGGFSGGSSRFGGFGSEDPNANYGGYSGGVYGDGGGFGGNESGFSDTQARRDRFEEYDEGDEVETSAPPRRTQAPSTQVRRETKKEEPKPKAPEPVADLLAWDDEPAPASSSAGKQPLAAAGDDFGDDDDFDDFQSAAPTAPAAPAAKSAAAPFIAPPNSTSTIGASTQFAAPQPHSAAQNNNLNDLFATVSPPPAANSFASPPIATPASATSSVNQPYRPSGYQATGPNYFTSVPVPSTGSTPSIQSPGIGGNKISSGAPKKAGGDAFASLLAGSAPKKTSTPTQKVTMADMAKQKTSQGLWGAPASGSGTPASQPQNGSKPGGALGDLLG